MKYLDTSCPNCNHLAEIAADGWIVCLRDADVADGESVCAYANRFHLLCRGGPGIMFNRVTDPQQRAANEPHTATT